MESVSTALAALGGLTSILAGLLVVLGNKLRVVEDPRIDVVEDMLPHANCGACGYPGCRPFAEALVAREAPPSKCTVSDEAGHVRIARYLGVEVGQATRRVARLACAGGAHVAAARAEYVGHPSCAAAALVAGGGKACAWGCLGLGDCVEVCDFDALFLDRHGLPVVREAKCTACGDCVEACPKDLFSLHPVEHRLWVACRSREAGDGVLEECEVGCTACGRCAKDAPDVIRMQDNLPVVDYAAPHQRPEAIERCPTGAIVWFDPERGIVRGAAAPEPVRQGARAPLST